MLKLGSAISLPVNTPETVDFISFDIDRMEWNLPVQKTLFIEKESCAQGGFRNVCKAKTTDGKEDFVIKKFRSDTVE